MATATYPAQKLDYHAPFLAINAPSNYEAHQSATPPLGIPSRYEGERVWSGLEMAAKKDEWITILSKEDQAQIVESLRRFQDGKFGPEAISPETFPLPSDLRDRLRKISYDCYRGRGFGVVRDLYSEALTEEEKVLVFAGVACHVAPQRGFQDSSREVVTSHVISGEERLDVAQQDLMPAFTNSRLAFHTDLGDILALLALDVSDTGGDTMIVSSSHIYNEIARIRPDLLQELSKDWAFFHSHDYETTRTPHITNVSGNKLMFQYSRLPVTGFRGRTANPSLPPPSLQRLEAMDLVEELSWRHSMALPWQRGDAVFINNLCTMHARTAFDLDAQGHARSSKRHLFKLMLRDPELAWDLPESLSWYSEKVYGPNQDNGARMEKWLLTSGSSSPNDDEESRCSYCGSSDCQGECRAFANG